MNSISKMAAAGVLAVAMSIVPSRGLAQNSTNKPPATKKASTEQNEATTKKKAGAGPFHGNLAAVDKVAKTITVGKRTFQITSETKIKKDDKPATLDDGLVGEEVGGYFKTGQDGKLNATSVRFGPKPGTTEKKKSTEKSEK